MAKLKTGGDTDAFCSKCDLELAHIIVAMVGDRIVRVQCKTCRTTHAYRRTDKTESRPRSAATGAPRAASPRGGGATRRQFEELMRGKDLSRARRYKPSESFAPGDIVDHPSFKFGVVARLLSDGKIEVAFDEGLKTLIHGRA
jgi:hypothetical protein